MFALDAQGSWAVGNTSVCICENSSKYTLKICVFSILNFILGSVNKYWIPVGSFAGCQYKLTVFSMCVYLRVCVA